MQSVKLDADQRRQELIVRFDVERMILVANLVEMMNDFMQHLTFHVSIMGSSCELRFTYEQLRVKSIELSSQLLKHELRTVTSRNSSPHERENNLTSLVKN